ncbi:MAG: head-tail adaptor protein [Clostridia bacterium]|nr:head-tail adaptor protein [Clostridia bacterium]
MQLSAAEAVKAGAATAKSITTVRIRDNNFFIVFTSCIYKFTYNIYDITNSVDNQEINQIFVNIFVIK